MRLRRVVVVDLAAVAVVMAAVGTSSATAAEPLGVAGLRSPSALTVSSFIPAGGAQSVFNRMTEAQRIGQLFMVGGAASGVGSATLSAISRYHVGNVILTGRSASGVAKTRTRVNGLQARATTSATLGVPLFVATDQEGGEVQVLSGSGFSAIPRALTQGGWSTATLASNARKWGGQLHAAGVNVNLAPVMDTVPVGEVNPPIGGFDREFGHTTRVVGPHGTAFAQGMAKAGVVATIKHFPGLGRVSENTDTHSGVTDHVTTPHDAYLAPFETAIRGGAQFAMMSTAYYHLIDATHPAAFSSKIIGGMLRRDLGFRGVVISDDLGGATQVAAWSPGTRAVDFINAGGDLVLTVVPSVIPAMVDAVSAQAARSSSFRAKVNAAVLLVLKAKQARGLIGGVTGDFSGAGRTDIAVWRPSTGEWFVRGHPSVVWGRPSDVPVVGDFNGDGRTDIAVWRPSTGVWFVRGQPRVVLGQAGDVPVAGDFDGDGRTDFAVWRPSTGRWLVRGHPSVHYGRAGDIPV